MNLLPLNKCPSGRSQLRIPDMLNAVNGSPPKPEGLTVEEVAQALVFNMLDIYLSDFTIVKVMRELPDEIHLVSVLNNEVICVPIEGKDRFWSVEDGSNIESYKAPIRVSHTAAISTSVSDLFC